MLAGNIVIETLILFLLLALLAEVLGTVGGFGSSLFFVPIAGYFLDFHTVLGVTALFHVSSNATKIWMFKEGFDRKLVFSIGIPAVLFVAAGAFLSSIIATRYLEIFLAVFLIAISLVLLLVKRLSIRPTVFNAVNGGILSGFIAGLVGTGGAIRGVVLAAFRLKKEVFIATSAMIDLAIDISRSVIYAAKGYVHRDQLYLILLLLGISGAGTYIGKRILRFIPEKYFHSMVLILVLITGLVTLSRYISF